WAFRTTISEQSKNRPPCASGRERDGISLQSEGETMRLGWMVAALALALANGAAADPLDEHVDPGLVRSVTAPLDHTTRSAPMHLRIELGAPFDATKPTVLVIEDGQQFFIQPGVAHTLQQTLFGDGVNVAALTPRGATPDFIRASLDAHEHPDWARAWALFQ